jgi:hypothetical protein
MASNWVLTEYDLAFMQSRSPVSTLIIPLVSKACSPLEDMNLHQWVNLSDKTYGEAFDELLAALGKGA